MGGCPRTYDDVDALTGRKAVQKWLQSLKEGPSRRAARYSIARYLRHLEVDADTLIDEVLDGTNRTLKEHLDRALDFCNAIDGSFLTRKKMLDNIRSFYSINGVALPRAKPNRPNTAPKVVNEPTATEYLEMLPLVLSFYLDSSGLGGRGSF